MALNQQQIPPQPNDGKVLQVSTPRASSVATPLFRRQAIEHISNRKYGTVLLAHPLSHRFLTLLFVSVAALIIGFFVFFSTTRKAQCSGVLLPNLGVIRVLPTQAGVVLSRQVVEGQIVHAGDVLFVLSSNALLLTWRAKLQK